MPCGFQYYVTFTGTKQVLDTCVVQGATYPAWLTETNVKKLYQDNINFET